MEKVVHRPLAVSEELRKRQLNSTKEIRDHHLFTVRVFLCPCTGVVLIKCLLKSRGTDSYILSKGFPTIEPFHKTAPNIMLAVPLNLFGRFAVENEANGILRGVVNVRRNYTCHASLPFRFPKSYR